MAFKLKNKSVAKMVKMAGNNRTAMKMKSESAMKDKHGKKELSGFEKAFADASAAGKKQFTYKGKPYNTLKKGEGGVVDTTKMTGGKPSIGIQGKTGKQKVKMMPEKGAYIKPSQREKMDDKAINQLEVSRVDRGYYD